MNPIEQQVMDLYFSRKHDGQEPNINMYFRAIELGAIYNHLEAYDLVELAYNIEGLI